MQAKKSRRIENLSRRSLKAARAATKPSVRATSYSRLAISSSLPSLCALLLLAAARTRRLRKRRYRPLHRLLLRPLDLTNLL